MKNKQQVVKNYYIFVTILWQIFSSYNFFVKEVRKVIKLKNIPKLQLEAIDIKEK